MKNLINVWIIFFFFTGSAFAADATSITMRANKKDGFIRIVFESSKETLTKQARVFTSYSLVKIDFFDDFTFKQLSKPESMDISKKDRSLYLNIKNLDKIKVIRLPSPPRLVLDAFLIGYKKERKKPPVIPGEKPQDLEIQTRTFLLDAGHGGHSQGIIGSNYKESSITLSVVRTLARHLSKKQRKVYYTRSSDKHLSIDKRISFAIKQKPELFMSFHLSNANYFAVYTWNVSTSTLSKEIWHNTLFSQIRHREESRKLAYSVGSAVKREFDMDVLYREMPLPLLSSINAPSVIIELPGTDFITYNKATFTKLGKTIVMGITEYEKR